MAVCTIITSLGAVTNEQDSTPKSDDTAIAVTLLGAFAKIASKELNCLGPDSVRVG